MDTFPRGAHYQYAFGEIAREHFSEGGVYYIDLWPVNGLALIVVSPHAATQAMQTNASLATERPAGLYRFFKPITGGPNLFDMPENEWKPWRAIFSKGFNAEHIQSLVPGMVREMTVYCETLRGLADKGDMFYLDPVTLRLTMDLIGRMIMSVRILVSVIKLPNR